jgi:MFS family permease
VGAPPGSSIFTPPFLTAATGNFLFFTNMAAYFLLPLHLKELGATEAELGLVMGVYSGTAIVCQPVVGVWVDRVGRRPFMLGGAALAGLASLLFALAPEAFAVLALLRILQGVANSMYFIANFAFVVALVPAARRGQALGIFGIAGLTSTALGPALGEVVVKAYGFRVFFAAAAALALAALAVSTRLAELPIPRAADPEKGAGLLAAILSAPRVPMALAFSFGLGTGVIFTFLPTYAATLAVARIGLFAVAYSVGALTVRAAAGRLIDTVGRRPIIVPALGLQAAGAVVLAAMGPLVLRGGMPPAPLLVVTGLLAGTAHGFLYPALSALVMDETPEERRGRMIGVFSAFILTGQATGAMGFGYLAHVLGYPPMFGVLAAALAGATALGFRLRS